MQYDASTRYTDWNDTFWYGNGLIAVQQKSMLMKLCPCPISLFVEYCCSHLIVRVSVLTNECTPDFKNFNAKKYIFNQNER